MEMGTVEAEVTLRCAGRTEERAFQLGKQLLMADAGDLNKDIWDSERLMKRSNWKIRPENRFETYFKGFK